MSTRKYSRRYRYKYKSYSFKLTYKQKDLIERCSKLKNTTPNKLIKGAIKDMLNHYAEMLEADSFVADNQLSLFRKEDYGEQLSIFDAIEKAEKE
jgi:hypothetical protein